MRLERFQVQLVQDLGPRLAVLWDAGTITAGGPTEATRVAQARAPASLRDRPSLRWRVVPARRPVNPLRSTGSPDSALPA